MLEYTRLLILEYGYISVFLLMMTNGIFSLPASEFVLALAGASLGVSYLSILHLLFYAISGNIIGCLILYYLSLFFGTKWIFVIRRYLYQSKYKIFNLIANFFPTENFIKFLIQKVNENGAIFVGLLRCFPVVRSIVSIPAGIFRMNIFIFILFSTIGISFWCLFWILMGFFLRESWTNYNSFASSFLFIILMMLLFTLHKRIHSKYIAWQDNINS